MPTAARLNTPDVEVARYRAGTASLLAQSIQMTRELEQRFGVDGESWEPATESELEADPAIPVRLECALLLRKARLHSDAVLRANAAGNLHSLAVQMRPVLECAGQVVFAIDNHFVAPRLTSDPEHAVRDVEDHLSAVCYDAIIRATKGKVGHEELLATIWETLGAAAESVGERAPKRRRGRSLKQAGKAASLKGGEAWYAHLSKCFCHDEGDLRGPTWRGGVKSMNTWRDELYFAGFMEFLAEQVNTMNAYAALCPAVGGDGQGWIAATLERLNEGRKTAAGLRNAAVSTFVDVDAPRED